MTWLPVAYTAFVIGLGVGLSWLVGEARLILERSRQRKARERWSAGPRRYV